MDEVASVEEDKFPWTQERWEDFVTLYRNQHLPETKREVRCIYLLRLGFFSFYFYFFFYLRFKTPKKLSFKKYVISNAPLLSLANIPKGDFERERRGAFLRFKTHHN
jgi:hypothetical protein